ncbi:MAG: hypothetical protein HXX12_04515 [Geothrix sp.]|uniref:hypothetical protein n=1 Tax=Geothrix sp. TaxID=1962974 RepID=UPI00179A30AA|nr:hypothetical protein [Geothrix sp.]NWJ40218.1 hypothetical protein [Geothrix sp.]WIL21776.1 MAG: hypothetical protein QOZ81_001047 [Geothrix sp.]
MNSKPFRHDTMNDRIDPGGAKGWCFDQVDENQENPRSIHLKALKKWHVITFDHTGREITTPMPDGEYTLLFPPGSANLSLLIIDPDPGGGERAGVPLP